MAAFATLAPRDRSSRHPPPGTRSRLVEQDGEQRAGRFGNDGLGTRRRGLVEQRNFIQVGCPNIGLRRPAAGRLTKKIRAHLGHGLAGMDLYDQFHVFFSGVSGLNAPGALSHDGDVPITFADEAIPEHLRRFAPELI